MLKKVNVVINIIGGVIDNVCVFAEEKDARIRYRELVEANSPWSREDVREAYFDNAEFFDGIWKKDSEEFLYDADNDLYYPISTENHDVCLREEFIDYDGYED